MKGIPRFIIKLFETIRGTIRYKLLVLGLFPILLIMPVALVLAVNWGKNFTYDQLFIKVNTDLSVSHEIFERIQQDYLNALESLANSYTFRTSFEVKNQQSYQQQVGQLLRDRGFSYLKLLEVKDEQPTILAELRNSSALLNALQGKPSVHVEIFSAKELHQQSSVLSEFVHLPLIKTPRARPSSKRVEDRGMVIRALYPIKDSDDQVIAILDGGVLLNANFSFVDTIRDLVYAPGNLPAGSIGTVTVFLDDVRINTNVPLKAGERALGTRVSNEVRTEVLDNGKTWIDRAFVVNDWYISSYEPIIDVDGQRVGMLYAGFLEAPFRSELWKALGALVFTLLGLMLVAALVAIRGAKSIFSPIETMSNVIKATQKGLPERVGSIASTDELGLLASEFDAMLDLLEHREEVIQQAADQFETKVIERTAELQKKNDDLSRTIQLLRETRQQLVIAEKLAALGEFTAGVAHEINNPTAVILGNIDVMLAELGDAAAPVQKEINTAIEQVYRIKDIINNLLQYARPDEYAGYIQKIDMNVLVDDSLKLINHLKKEQEFEVELDLKATTSVEINTQECQQILVNLLVNAVHALPSENGVVHIHSRDWNDKGIMVAVRGNGSGIAEKTLNQIFNPFYSTKKTGKGTGLGLTVSYSLIRRYGGNLTVESELGKGTEFRLWIREHPRFMEDEETIIEQLRAIEVDSKSLTPPGKHLGSRR